jgi:hypothetical protein
MTVIAHISGPQADAIGIAVTMVLVAAVVLGVFLAWFVIWALMRVARSTRKASESKQSEDNSG